MKNHATIAGEHLNTRMISPAAEAGSRATPKMRAVVAAVTTLPFAEVPTTAPAEIDVDASTSTTLPPCKLIGPPISALFVPLNDEVEPSETPTIASVIAAQTVPVLRPFTFTKRYGGTAVVAQTSDGMSENEPIEKSLFL